MAKPLPGRIKRGDRQTLLLLIDAHNPFCLPEFELFIGGRSGRREIDDNNRICEFIYDSLGEIDQIIATMNTHHLDRMFHRSFWIDSNGEHSAPAKSRLKMSERMGRTSDLSH